MARSGIASPVISSPNWLIVWPVQSFMKSPWRHRLGRWGVVVASSSGAGSAPGSSLDRHFASPSPAQSGV